jgi:hypothetical protein
MLNISIGTRVTRGSTLFAAGQQPLLCVYSHMFMLKNAFLRSLYPSSHHPRFAFIEIAKYSFPSLQIFIIKTHIIEF